MSKRGKRVIISLIVVTFVYLILFNWRIGNLNAVIALTSIITALIAIFAVLESNYTSRFCIGADLLIRLEERFISREMKEKRKNAAKAIKAIKDKSDKDVNVVITKDENVATILDFFSVIGILAHQNVLDKEMVWRTFFSWLCPYYVSLEKYIEDE